jgi:hypothetical protein
MKMDFLDQIFKLCSLFCALLIILAAIAFEQKTLPFIVQAQSKVLAQGDVNIDSQILLQQNQSTQSAEEATSNCVVVQVGAPTGPTPTCAPTSDLLLSTTPPPAPIDSPGGNRPEAPPVEPGNLRQAIIDKFGITMNGYSNQYMQWAWERLWEVSHTNFDELVKGSIINITNPADTHQSDCPNTGKAAVFLGAFGDAKLFKHVLTHELGHVIANCHPRGQVQREAHLKAFVAEGGVSDYGRNAHSCTGSDNISEDYAEMIAYYLNPGYAVSTVRCYPAQNPNMSTNFTLHYKVAKDILGEF